MEFNVRFVDFIDHDYRRKYRVIERIGDIEFAGGMVGDVKKVRAINEVVAESEIAESEIAESEIIAGSDDKVATSARVSSEAEPVSK